jgi:hypothetical protein
MQTRVAKRDGAHLLKSTRLRHSGCCTGLDERQNTPRLAEAVRTATDAGAVIRCSACEGNCKDQVSSRCLAGGESLGVDSAAQCQTISDAGLYVVADPAAAAGDDAAR